MQVQTNLKYINDWFDADLGRRRYRFRRRGFPGVELPDNPDSPEFHAAYHSALRGEKTAVVSVAGSGTVANAIERYLDSTTFNDDYSSSTKALRRSVLNSVSRLVGKLPLAQMNKVWVERWLETVPTKGVKRTRLLALKPFTKWAVESVHLIAADPTEGIKVKAKESNGHATWTDEEIEQYRARHPVGTKARLALELLLAVAARLGDGISLGRQHVKDGWLVYTQEKNRKRKPVTVEMPLPASLVAAIEACPSPPEALTFLTNEWGRPFGKKAFGTWFRKRCDEAGLPDTCVPHGLRKAGCRIMAESDCTSQEIMSVSGHTTLKEVGRYTKAVNKKRLAVRAQSKVAAAKDNVVPLAVAAKR